MPTSSWKAGWRCRPAIRTAVGEPAEDGLLALLLTAALTRVGTNRLPTSRWSEGLHPAAATLGWLLSMLRPAQGGANRLEVLSTRWVTFDREDARGNAAFMGLP